MPSRRYNPNSIDATLATILGEVKAIREDCKEIKAEAKQTNGRVRSLEVWRAVITSKVAMISGIVALAGSGLAWFASYFFG